MGIVLLALAWLGPGCAGVRGPAAASGVVTGRVIGTGPEHAAGVVYLEPLTHAEATETEAPARHRLSALLNTRFAIVRAGLSLKLENDTPVFHRIFSRSAPNAFELESLKSGSSVSLPVLERGEIHLYCSLHPSEDAILLALSSPWAALVDTSGSFRIEGVREGTYRVIAWDDGAVRASATIHVRRGAALAIDLPLRRVSVGTE